MPKTRFFAWYRLMPLAAVFAFGLISFVYSCAPAAFFKPLYPIDYEAYVMQLMPVTAQDMITKGLVDCDEYSADNLNDPATNIEFGCAYLSYLLTYFNGSTDSAIAAYNAGMGNVDGWAQQNTSLHNAITFPETQAYLIRVNNAWVRYKTLYPDRFV